MPIIGGTTRPDPTNGVADAGRNGGGLNVSTNEFVAPESALIGDGAEPVMFMPSDNIVRWGRVGVESSTIIIESGEAVLAVSF